jgi:pimeloyl-[acyl-carrier protein] methyl ester esterase
MTLFTYTTGQGPDVVLLHGWGMNGDVWEGILPALTARYRTTIVDLPGHGRSMNSLDDYNLPNLARTIAAAIPQKAIVVGWSLGGMVASQLALDNPAQVTKLILVASAPQFVRDTSWPDGTDDTMLKGFADELTQNYQQTIKRFIAIQALGSDHAREQQRILRERVFRHGQPQAAALEGGLDILRSANLRPQLANINCPTLFIAGEMDSLFRPAAAQRAQGLMTDADLSVIDKAGHAPFLSHPDEFLQSLTRFIDD